MHVHKWEPAFGCSNTDLHYYGSEKLQQFLFLKYVVRAHAIWTRRISMLNPHWLLKSYPREFTVYSGSYFTESKHKTKHSLFETLSENSMVGVERRKSVFIQRAHEGDWTLNVNSRKILFLPMSVVSCLCEASGYLWGILPFLDVGLGCLDFWGISNIFRFNICSLLDN